jgi:hypothetical protein
VPSVEEEDARRLHRELERLKREGLAHRTRVQSLLVMQGIKVRTKNVFGCGLASSRSGTADRCLSS